MTGALCSDRPTYHLSLSRARARALFLSLPAIRSDLSHFECCQPASWTAGVSSGRSVADTPLTSHTVRGAENVCDVIFHTVGMDGVIGRTGLSIIPPRFECEQFICIFHSPAPFFFFLHTYTCAHRRTHAHTHTAPPHTHTHTRTHTHTLTHARGHR